MGEGLSSEWIHGKTAADYLSPGNHATCGTFDGFGPARRDDKIDYTLTGTCPDRYVVQSSRLRIPPSLLNGIADTNRSPQDNIGAQTAAMN
jgi:hypothetical protein